MPSTARSETGNIGSKNSTIDEPRRTVVTIDFGRHSDDYSRYRPGLPVSFYEHLERLLPIRGVTALDIGTGPGVVALELARRGAQVLGIDIAENQVAAAQRRAEALGLTGSARFEVGRAEQIARSDASFDLIVASQCWWWLDGPRARSEAVRLLRPGGTLCVVQYCYLPTAPGVARDTEALVLKLNPAWTMAGFDGFFPEHLRELPGPDLRLRMQLCYDEDCLMSHEVWRGRMRTCNGVGSGGMDADRVRDFDHQLERLLRDAYPEEPLVIPHRIWATVLEKGHAAD